MPESSAVATNLKAPSLPTYLNNTFFISAYNSPLTISGFCGAGTTEIQMNLGAGWQLVPSPSLNCASGNFSFTISDSSTLGFNNSSTAGTIRDLPLRAYNSSSLSISSSVTVKVKLASLRTQFATVNSGGGLMQSSSYKIYSKIGARVPTQDISSTNLKMKLQGAN